MRFLALIFITLLLPALAFADQMENDQAGKDQLYQIYFFDPKVGKDFILLEKLMVRDSKFYVSADWAIQKFALNWNITDTNNLVISRAHIEPNPALRGVVPPDRTPWAKHELSITIEGNAFLNFMPSESRNPLQSYVDLETFTQATGNTYAFTSKTQVIHIRIEGDKPVEQKQSACQEWIHSPPEAQSENTPFNSGKGHWRDSLRPVCNESDEIVSEVSGKAIVFFGPPCQGGAPRDLTEENKAWQKDVVALRQRYDIVDENNCPCCIP